MCCEWELTQKAREEAHGLRAVMEEVQPAPHRPRGWGSPASPQAGVQAALCLREAVPRALGVAHLNPQPLGSEFTQPFSKEGVTVVWQ